MIDKTFKFRSDSKIPKIKEQVIKLLQETNLSYTEIGKLVGCSRGPIYTIDKTYNIKRNEMVGRKYSKIKCKTCNNEFVATDRQNRFCSKECYTKWQKSEDNRGEHHPRWKGGCETNLQLLRKTDDWKNWRTEVFKRDKYICKKCGQVGGKLDPHHYIPKSVDISKVFDLDNGITLCHKCHMFVHNTKDKDFLKCSHQVSNQYS